MSIILFFFLNPFLTKRLKMQDSKSFLHNPIRMTIRSDPVVQHFDPVVQCKICGGRGHSHFSCEYSTNRNREMIIEEIEFWKYVDQSEQPVINL